MAQLLCACVLGLKVNVTSQMAAYSDAGRSYALRMILLGEAGTGKTCLYHRIKYKVGNKRGRKNGE